MYLATNLKHLRECRGETQKEVAELLSVSKQTASVYEKGEIEPDISKLIKIAEHFEISIDDLLRKDLRPPKPMYSKNLKVMREKYGMSQEETSRLLGLKDKSSCCLVENGKQKLSVEQLMKISEYFGFTMDQFVKHDLSETEV